MTLSLTFSRTRKDSKSAARHKSKWKRDESKEEEEGAPDLERMLMACHDLQKTIDLNKDPRDLSTSQYDDQRHKKILRGFTTKGEARLFSHVCLDTGSNKLTVVEETPRQKICSLMQSDLRPQASSLLFST